MIFASTLPPGVVMAGFWCRTDRKRLYRCLHRTWDRPRAPCSKKKKKDYTTPLDL